MKNQTKWFISLVVLTVLLWSAVSVLAQEKNTREMYYDISELAKLIERAREAGFSEDQIQRMDIRDGRDAMSVQAYIERVKASKIKQDQEIKNFLNKKFLTTRDIFKELLVLEPRVLTRLREDLVSVQ